MGRAPSFLYEEDGDAVLDRVSPPTAVADDLFYYLALHYLTLFILALLFPAL
jgi:hypothetical protein